MELPAKKFSLPKYAPHTIAVAVAVGFVAILLLVVLGFGAKAALHEITKERPHFNTGTVIQKDFTPAHTDMVPQQQYAGEDCTSRYDSYTKSYTRSCSPRYITIWVPRYVPDAWDIEIQNCNVYHKDGRLWVDKQGNAKCFKKWISVDQTTYTNYTIKEKYGS